jgi:hypothetical protein
MTTLNAKIADIPIPTAMSHLRISDKGFPVPYFVAWMQDGEECAPGHGQPDFRMVSAGKVRHCHTHGRCWVCGGLLGKYRTFVIGPMCAVNRVSSEPPSHYPCARYAAQACPFLTQPRARRNVKDLPEGYTVGEAIERNPGVTLIWTCTSYGTRIVDNGILFRIGDPTNTEWWCQGRLATRDEVMASIDSGLPLLQDMAAQEGERAVRALEALTVKAKRLVPA